MEKEEGEIAQPKESSAKNQKNEVMYPPSPVPRVCNDSEDGYMQKDVVTCDVESWIVSGSGGVGGKGMG